MKLVNVFATGSTSITPPPFINKVLDLLIAARGWLLVAVGIIAAIMFLICVIKYMATDDEGLRVRYRRAMIGIGIALGAAYSVIGIISWLGDVFGS